MALKFIDVSAHNGNVDFSKIKSAGYDGVIIRAGFGKLSSQVDKKFDVNYANAKRANLRVGVYWYSYATTVNEAKQEDFEQLPGIGPSIAQRIVEYRDQNGKFTSIDELQEVKGIGEAKFENIKEYVTIK